MALAGEGAICIWNDITDEGRAEFYAWHLTEHMPERVGIPGFLRGRRYIAVDGDTSPEFFTLYETISYETIPGTDYQTRLNNPTPWTQSATKGFRNTSRALTRVRGSYGPGSGGILATIRFDALARPQGDLDTLRCSVLPSLANLPRITGVHLCQTDAATSAIETAESRGRTDISAPANGVVLIEGCDPEGVRDAVARLGREPLMAGFGASTVGLYRVEYTRLKNAHAPG
jgi:hypothetical protein